MTASSLDTIVSVLAAIISIIAILSLAVKAGKWGEISAQMKRDIERAHARIDGLENSMKHTELELGEMHSDVKYLVKTVDEIKATMTRHTEQT